MIERIEIKDIILKIDSFLKSHDTVFMDKRFDSLCKIHNPFGFVEFGDIYEVEITNPNLIIELDWIEFISRFDLNLRIDLNTSMEAIHKTFRQKYGEQEFDNFYWASGCLGSKQIEKISEIIKEHFNSDTLFCYYSWITNLVTDNPEDEIFLTGFKDLKQLIKNKKTYTPTIWWDKELNWLVYTDPDLTSSYVFSDNNLVEKIFNESELESFKINIKDYHEDIQKNILK